MSLPARRPPPYRYHARRRCIEAGNGVSVAKLINRVVKEDGGFKRGHSSPASRTKEPAPVDVGTAEFLCRAGNAHQSLVDALKMARECITYCRRAHPDIQAEPGDGVPVEVFIDEALRLAEKSNAKG